TVFGERKGRFGHLREVGVGGFVPAVEQEERGTWVVVHLYDPSVDRCYTLDDTLSRLARRYPDTKFIRVRASALGFATKQPSSSSTRAKPSGIRRATRTIREDDDDDDPFGDEKSGFVGRHEDDESERSSDEDDDNVDTDMLPTMLVYRDGELVFNWVRVDFEAGQAGIEELLLRHHVLPTSGAQNNCGLPSDDELFDDD
ncbi:thioredoxin-like protein, partial [Punctularia strigosozonata HHB-11173 SS5]